ncbi:MAG: UvrD-helicase domain-containing protein [Halobacteriota archaeon]
MDTTIEQIKSRYNLNGDQIEAITTTNSPVQIIAGSGAGKTFVLILRALYLLMTGSVRPKGMQTVRFSVLLRARDSP